MRGWQCSRCNQLHTQNASKCRRCGHRILSPASREKLEKASDGIEGVDSVEVEHTVGTPDEYSVDSSPDVAVDGSIKGANESEEQQEDRGFFIRVLARFRSE